MTRRSRRSVLQTLGTAAAALTVNPLSGALEPTAAAAGIRIGLSQYSLRQPFRSGDLDIMDYPGFARDRFGITDIDVWEGGMPAQQQNDSAWLKKMKQTAIDEGSNIFLWMTGAVNCTAADASGRKSEAQKFHQPIDNAAILGCDYVRIFVKAPDIDRTDAVSACVETLSPVADYAHNCDVMLVIEPGASTLTRDGSFVAEIMKTMAHQHCRLMPDFGKLGGDIYAGSKAMLPWTEVVSAKSHDFDADGNEEKFDYARLIGDVRASGFQGIIAIEYEGHKLGPVEGVRATQQLIRRCLTKPL